MVGSKRKAIAIFRELTADGIDPKSFERVHSPIGLDIGAISPEEISISILAELIAARRQVERVLPHMSWFQSTRGRMTVEDGQARISGSDLLSDEACPADR
jgi:xanthine/CO dehydrogenase XdhC/CoxF family maturation factor